MSTSDLYRCVCVCVFILDSVVSVNKMNTLIKSSDTFVDRELRKPLKAQCLYSTKDRLRSFCYLSFLGGKRSAMKKVNSHIYHSYGSPDHYFYVLLNMFMHCLFLPFPNTVMNYISMLTENIYSSHIPPVLGIEMQVNSLIFGVLEFDKYLFRGVFHT